MEFPFGHGHHHHHHPETNELDRDSYPPPPQPSQYQPPYGYDGPPPPQPDQYRPPYGYDGPPPPQPGHYRPPYGYDGPPPPQPGQYQPPYGYDGPPPPQPGHYRPPYGYDGPPPPPPPGQQHQPFGYDGPPPGHLPYGGAGGGDGYNRLPPTVHQFGGGGGYGGPDNSSYGGPPPPAVEHVSHEGGGGGGFFGHHLHHHPRPQEHGGSYVQHAGQDGGSAGRKPTVRIYTKAEENYSLSVRDGKVVLAKADNTDPYQHWIKDLKYSTKVKDEEGFPSFSLVNKVTGEALKHSIGATHPVRLIPYNADYLDESILWTESKDLGDGFRCIRMVNNIRLNFDAFHGDEDHGGVHDGTTLVLWEWLKGKNQRWKIVPY